MDQGLERVKIRLKKSISPLALTGAGVSAESGVPTFRGEDGLWRSFRPEDLATPEAFERDPALVWEWYNWRRDKISGLQPNAAHRGLAELGRRIKGFTLITQNVDGLHSLAGSCPVELHGSIWRVRCQRCDAREESRDALTGTIPGCRCGGMLRPDVVWFGEALDEAVITKAFSAASNADFMIVAGTSGIVQPAASLAGRAREAGAFIIEINPERTPLSGIMDERFEGKAEDVIPKLLEW